MLRTDVQELVFEDCVLGSRVVDVFVWLSDDETVDENGAKATATARAQLST